jgi:hypothetical protein
MIGHPRNVLRSVGFGAITLLLAAHVGCGSTNNSTGYSGNAGGGGGSTAGGGGGGGAGGGIAGGGGGAGGGGSSTPDGGGAGGGGSATPDGGGGDDGGNVDAGGPSSGPYPPAGLTIDVAQVVNGGAAVMSAPIIVTVTWSIDPDAATYNAMGDAIGASSYWHAINSEYGIGPATSGSTNHVSITTPPTNNTIADTDIDSLVDTNVGSAWPASTANTMYMIYLPPGVKFTSGGQDQCGSGLGGYHTTSQKNNYVYGIALHCSNFQTSDVELSASHEMNEAVTDPLVGGQAWVGFDANHLSFEFFNAFQDELGDACEAFVEATDTTDFTPYTVQRQWSNKSAAAGSHWCVPALPEPFYNVTYASGTTLDTITANLTSLGNGAGSTTSKGFKVAVGATRTFQIEYFSDVQTQTGFTLDVHGLPSTDGSNVQPIATDQGGNNIANGDATVTIDNPVGSNGMTANVSITPKSFSSLGVTFFYIRAVLPGAQQHHYLPILISQN